MISYNVGYEDYEGRTRIETHYFNLNQTELTVLNARYGGSLQNTLSRLSMTENAKEMMDILIDVFKSSYGRMDDDRVHFRKSERIWDDFASTPAFDKLFMQIMGSDEKSAAFVKGVLPKKMAEEADYGIDWQAQDWHLNRLMTLLQVCSEKSKPPKKMPKSTAAARQRALNAARRKKYNTGG